MIPSIFARLQKKEEDQALSGQGEREISFAPRQASGFAGWVFAVPFQEVKTEFARYLGGL